MAITIDEKVISLQEKVEEKKRKISKAERPQWLTNCAIKFKSGVAYNLQAIQSVEECVSIFGEILAAARQFEAAKEELGVAGSFSFGGFPLADWKADFQTRTAIISIQREKQKLRQLEEALQALESNELKAQRTLAEIEKALAND